MRAITLIAAAPLAALALSASPAPAQAQFAGDPGPAAHAGAAEGPLAGRPSWHGGFGGSRDFGTVCDVRHRRGFDDHGDRPHRRGRAVACNLFVGGWGAPEGRALYNNRGWESDSYNDWWHDQPWRSYPRWVGTNQNCAPERMWWSGGRWRC